MAKRPVSDRSSSSIFEAQVRAAGRNYLDHHSCLRAGNCYKIIITYLTACYNYCNQLCFPILLHGTVYYENTIIELYHRQIILPLNIVFPNFEMTQLNITIDRKPLCFATILGNKELSAPKGSLFDCNSYCYF